MSGNLEERLMQAKAQLRLKRKLEAMLGQAQKAVQEEQMKCSTLKELLAREKADVDKLEGLSLTGLFYSVMGTKGERIGKEQQEFLEAKLKHDEAQELLKDVQREVERLEDELTPLFDADAEYDRLLDEKEKVLAGAGDVSAKKLMEMSVQLADLSSDREELQEAVAAGQTALKSLRKVSSELGSAANWGTWDMLGGGMISTMAKHSRIDSAKEHAHHAQRQLRRFQEELADTNERLHMSLEIGGFSKFADFFFDGLIADWVVQSKLSEASSACSTTISKVSSVVNQCQRKLAETEQVMKDLNESRQEFIERT